MKRKKGKKTYRAENAMDGHGFWFYSFSVSSQIEHISYLNWIKISNSYLIFYKITIIIELLNKIIIILKNIKFLPSFFKIFLTKRGETKEEKSRNVHVLN